MSTATASPTMAAATRGVEPAARLGLDHDDASTPSRLAALKATATDKIGGVTDLGEFAFSTADAYASEFVDREQSQFNNIIGAAITLGLSIILLILMAIVAGYFVAEAPSDGAFSESIQQVESVGGTAFILLAVALLAVPVVAIVGYFMRSGLGGFISGGGMGR